MNILYIYIVSCNNNIANIDCNHIVDFIKHIINYLHISKMKVFKVSITIIIESVFWSIRILLREK